MKWQRWYGCTLKKNMLASACYWLFIHCFCQRGVGTHKCSRCKGRITLYLWQLLFVGLSLVLASQSVVSIIYQVGILWFPRMTVMLVIPGFYYVTQSSLIVDIPCHSEWLDVYPVPLDIVFFFCYEKAWHGTLYFLAIVCVPVSSSAVQFSWSNCVLNAVSVAAFLQFRAVLWCQRFIKILLIKGRFCLLLLAVSSPPPLCLPSFILARTEAFI